MAGKRILDFAPDSRWYDPLTKWHESLKEDRGGRAALRSCATPIDVVFVPTYHQLFHELADRGKAAIEDGSIDENWNYVEQRLFDRLPVIAGLVAHVEREPDDDYATIAKQMGLVNPGEDRPLVSDLRFRRLLKCREVESLYPALRRVIQILGKKVNICRLANDLYFWSEEQRKRWAYDYYASMPLKTERTNP